MILGVGHTAYGVKDLGASLRFYVHQLGLEKAFTLHRDDGSLWIVYLYAGDRTFIELFPEQGPPAKPAEGGTGSGSRAAASYKHLCLRVDDMSLTLDGLKKRGLEPLGPASVGKDGNTQAWLRDPDGNLIELMQIAPTSDQAKHVEGSRPA